MIKTFTYPSGIPAKTAIRALIASTRIVFITSGEANLVRDIRG